MTLNLLTVTLKMELSIVTEELSEFKAISSYETHTYVYKLSKQCLNIASSLLLIGI